MTKIPMPIWLTLTEVISYLIQRGINENDAQHHLLRAFQNGQILTRGRGRKYIGHENKIELDPSAWDRSQVDWINSAFAIPDSRGYAIDLTDVDISRDGLFYWLEQGSVSGEKQNVINELDYIPPYLEFMMKAIIELDLAKKQRPLKKHIESWLIENWPPDLGSPSERLIGNMATLLRPPGAQKGGNIKLSK